MKIDEEHLKKAPYLDIESADASGLLWSDVKALREKLGMSGRLDLSRPVPS